MNDFLTELANVLGAERYMQHAVCLTNDFWIMFLYVFGHGVIFISYTVIGLTWLIYAAKEISPPKEVRWLYGSFIFMCGITHLTAISTLYVGIYRLEVLILALTAGISAATGIVTFRDISGASIKEADGA